MPGTAKSRKPSAVMDGPTISGSFAPKRFTTPPRPTREQEHDQGKWREGRACRRRRVSLHLNQVEGQEVGRPAQSRVQEEREQIGEERAADPLHRACDDELSNSRRQAAPDRREREDNNAQRIDAATPNLVAQGSSNQDEG